MCLQKAFLVFCAFGMAASFAPEPDDLRSRFFAILDNAIGQSDDFQLVPGVSFVKTSDASSPRSTHGDLVTTLLDRVNLFFQTHSLKFELVDADEPAGAGNVGRAVSDDKDAVEESRGKKDKKGKKQKNLIIPLILAMKAKMAVLSAAMANTIAIIAGKALLVSKIALILGFMLFLKKLVQNPPKNVEETHIKHKKIVLPQEEHISQPDGLAYGKANDWERGSDRLESKWSNSYDYNLTAQEMAYRRRFSKPLM